MQQQSLLSLEASWFCILLGSILPVVSRYDTCLLSHPLGGALLSPLP